MAPADRRSQWNEIQRLRVVLLSHGIIAAADLTAAFYQVNQQGEDYCTYSTLPGTHFFLHQAIFRAFTVETL